MRMKVLVMVLVGLVFLVGCNKEDWDTGVPMSLATGIVISPQNFGNGVYYFPVINESFGKSLAAFKAANPEKRILAVTSNLSGRGSGLGYWIICEEK